MADEELAIASTPGLETAPEAPVTTEPETTASEPTKVDDLLEAPEIEDVPEPEIETTEIEWDDGKKYVIPKALEGGILKNKDYTTKTQETAALRKQLESREAEITQRLEATEAELEARAELRSVTTQLAEYAKLTPQDWYTHQQNDPMAVQQAQLQWTLLNSRKAELEGIVKSAADERTQKAQQGLAKRIEETLAEAPKIIPGWKPDGSTIKELVSFAQSEGIPDQVLQDNWSPQLLKLLHRAKLGTSLLNTQAAKPIPTVVPQPLQTVAGKSKTPTSGDLGSLDMDAYIAARKKGVGGKALR